ncbi:acetyl-CoA synthetase [Legionella beliardensis]|uniref:Acetate--CoA ligase n=2 Tax=Legionella beliardensis TaxID=91822 RepID=A0A378I584_9GAMM|nr:acetyl-CoA synthetase [Legionella beliardensis]
MDTQEQRDSFWNGLAKQYVDWMAPWDKVSSGDFTSGNIQWFINGKLNVSANCLDKHLPTKGNHTAILWEGDNEHEQKSLTFAELHQEVCLMANGLKSLGIKKGDTVAIYLPMIPEAIMAMLACTRIGAIHTVVFAGFSATALRQRLEASQCKLLITSDSYQRGGKLFPLKLHADEASESLNLKTLVIKHSQAPVSFDPVTNYWWHDIKATVDANCTPEMMDAEDPLFILYTSGSTGKPKGLVHTTGGYLVQVAYSFQQIFAPKADDVFWCTADIGWITGHSYLIYGPLCNGITTLVFGGVPTWPDPARCWKMIDKYQVNIFYTAPTAIRALKRAGDQWLDNTSRQSLRLLGSVGEPISPEVWLWYYEKVGAKRCLIVDTWWQTETGSIMLSPQDKTLQTVKPGCACQPLPGIYPVLLDENYHEIAGAAEGILAIKYPWPSLARTIAGDHPRYRANYFHNGYYITGDGAHRDAESDYWISGRIDDVLNVSGHRLGTAEIESALIAHPDVAEVAVVGVPHAIKGQGIYAFVSLQEGCKPSAKLQDTLIENTKAAIGAIAKPDTIQWVHDLPKTRSGKIMRRVLRLIASDSVNALEELGDLSTLANPQAIEELFKEKSHHTKSSGASMP